jgi:hypothetical protein
MSNVMPEGENLRRAVRWISEQRQESTPASITDLIDEAGRRFDLSPMDQVSLMHLLHDQGPEPES